MPEDVSGTAIKLISGLVTVSVGFLPLLALVGKCTQGRHVKTLCREPKFQFAVNLNTLHSLQASTRLEGVTERRYSAGMYLLAESWLRSQVQHLLAWAASADRPCLC